MGSLKGRLALITGAGRGIGRSIAIRLAHEGADLVLAARSHDELTATAVECQKNGVRVDLVAMDMKLESEVRKLSTTAIQVKGFLDILVNNAGMYGPIGPSHEVSYRDWAEAHMVNLMGPFLLTQLVVPSMIARRSGRIIFVGGGGATQPLPFFSAYASSKAAVVRLAETWALELERFNIRVNAISPGLVDTKMQDEVMKAKGRAGPLFDKIEKARREGSGAVSPELAADLVAFLASDASTSITGKLIAAPYDPWKEWEGHPEKIMGSPMYTLRRLDPHTIQSIKI